MNEQNKQKKFTNSQNKATVKIKFYFVHLILFFFFNLLLFLVMHKEKLQKEYCSIFSWLKILRMTYSQTNTVDQLLDFFFFLSFFYSFCSMMTKQTVKREKQKQETMTENTVTDIFFWNNGIKENGKKKYIWNHQIYSVIVFVGNF